MIRNLTIAGCPKTAEQVGASLETKFTNDWCIKKLANTKRPSTKEIDGRFYFYAISKNQYHFGWP
jgi:hypothetical protein